MANDFSVRSASMIRAFSQTNDAFGGTASTAHPLEPGIPLSGRIDSADDIDAFRFKVETGTLYTVDLTVGSGGRLSAALASADQYSPPQSAVWNTGTYSWVAHASGTVNLSLSGLEGMPAYTLALAKAVDDIGSTRLLNRPLALEAIGSGRIDAANDIDWFALQLEAGKTYAFDYSGDGNATAPLKVSLQRFAPMFDDSVNQMLVSGARFVPRETATYYIQASSSAVQHYTVKVSEQPDDLVGAGGTGMLVPIGGSRSARIDFAGDRDAFKLAVLEGHVYRISLDNREMLAFATIGGAATALLNHDGRLGTSNQFGVRDYYVRADASGELLVTVEGRSAGAYSVAAVDVLTDAAGNAKSTALPLALGARVGGVIDYGSDVDSYRVAVEAGVSYVATVTPVGTGGPFDVSFSPPTGGDIRSTYFTPDSSGAVTLNVAGLSYSGPAAGAYTVNIARVRGDYTANTATDASLIIGNTFYGTLGFSGDHDWVAVSLVAGRHYAFQARNATLGLYDGDGARIHAYDSAGFGGMHFTAPLSGTYYLGASNALGETPGDYTLSASALDSTDDYPYLAIVQAGQTVNGKLDSVGDTDRFALSARSDQFYRIELTLFDASGAVLADSMSNAQGVLASWMKSSTYVKPLMAGDGAVVFQTQLDTHLNVSMGGDARVASYRITYSALAQDAERSDGAGIVVEQGASQGGNLQVAGDSDVFLVTLLAGERVALALRGLADGAGTLDLQGAPLALLRTDPQLLPGDVRYETGSAQRAIFTAPADKTYAFDVGTIGRAGSYTVSLERIGIGMEERSARAGNDWFDAKGWGSFIDGGAGIDTVRYQLKASEVTIGADAGARTVAWGDYRPDVLIGIERLYFAADGSARAFDIDGVAGDAYRLYRAAFDRKPDDAGAGFWMYFLEHGMSRIEMAKGFMGSPEFVALYGTAPSDLDFVQRLYSNVLHRQGEQGGVDFYLDLLANGTQRAQVLDYFASSPENQQAVAVEIGQGFAYIPYG